MLALVVYNAVFSNQKTCSGGVGSHGLMESYLDNANH